MAYVAVAVAVVGMGVSYQASRNQAKTAEQVGKHNAQMNEYSAQDAQRRGAEEAAAIQRKGAAIKSSQRAALAAKGLDLTYGTSADLIDQTDFFTQSDVATARNNAARDAWSARAQGGLSLAQGNAAAANARMEGNASLLSGAGQVAGRWYDMNKPPPKAP
jgi:hypothetical protein